MFKIPFTPRDRHFGNPGRRVKDKNTLIHDERGNMKLQKVGEVDVYDLIQSYAPECDIEYLVSRFERGDVECLNRRCGFYGDISNAPTNPAEYRNSLIAAQGAFEKNEELCKKYNGDFGKFLEDHQTLDAVNVLLGISKKTAEGVTDAPAAAPAVNNDEQKQ